MVLRLTGVVRHYAWGRTDGAISQLTGAEPCGQPEAELWMGAHPSAPSLLPDGRTLSDAVDDDPVGLLGSAVVEEFGSLPFLFKVLAAELPLSIQAHPSADRARAGFVREDAAGIAVDAPERTYRDPNHKPELICALTPFEAKCGFRPLAGTRRLFEALATVTDVTGHRTAVFDELVAMLGRDGSAEQVLSTALRHLLEMPTSDARRLADAVPVAAARLSGPVAVEFAADLGACGLIGSAFPGDIGGVVALLLNHVQLQPGEALFLGSGNLHAYVRGVGVELMANSDNVLRGGLTPKHIDIVELLAVVECEPSEVVVQRPTGRVHTYDSPVREFALTRIELGSEPVVVEGPAIVLLTEGIGRLGGLGSDHTGSDHTGSDSDELVTGAPVFVAAGSPITVAGSGLAWLAGVGASLTRS